MAEDTKVATPEAWSVSASAVTHGILPLKDGDTFAVFDVDGQMAGGTTGLYHRDTRHLSHWRIILNDNPSLMLGCATDEEGVLMNADMMPQPLPGIREATGLHLRATRFLWQGSMHERISIRNHSLIPQEMRLRIEFTADFRDLFQVRGTPRTQEGTMSPADVGECSVSYACRGLDGRMRRTQVFWSSKPTHLLQTSAEFTAVLQPGVRFAVGAQVLSGEGDNTMSSTGFTSALLAAKRSRRALLAGAASLQTSDSSTNTALARARSDLYMLVTQKPEGLVPYAGVPWFSTVFGRDALLTALMALPLDHRIASGTLCYLARNQATEIIETADAQPGKIIHEIRHGDMAETGEVPFRRYYGSVDSTPLFVALAGAYMHRTGDMALMDELWPHIEAALGWLAQWGDTDGDGFIEYGTPGGDGLANQGWKDSWDSISHADGTLATGPIALCEVQGYAYAAWIAGAEIAQALGMIRRAKEWFRLADRLKVDFGRRFWSQDMNSYALALDGDKRRCKVLSSNAGAVLWTGIAQDEHAQSVVSAMTSPRMWTGWGVRTLAQGEKRYDPTSYHNGSVWPHDNAMIAMGMARHGYLDEAAQLLTGMLGAADAMPSRRLPELFCGFRKLSGQPPVPYPVACSPQAWATTALPSMLVSCLSMNCMAAGAGTLTFVRPKVPEFLHEVSLTRMEVGDGHLDVTVSAGSSSVRVDKRTGGAQVATYF